MEAREKAPGVTIGDLFKEKEATKGKIRKIKEIVDE